MQANIHLVKSFTQDPEQGSPTGVVLDPHGELTDSHMRQIATELDFAESAFVQPSGLADYRLRFFAPNHEVNLCGHATIAAFHTLVEQGDIQLDHGLGRLTLIQETAAGFLGVTCHPDGRIVMEQAPPEVTFTEENRERVAQMLGVAASELVPDLPLEVVSTGTPKLLVPLVSLQALRAVRPDLEAIKDYYRATGARGVYPFTRETPIPDTDFYARQFNPLADANEDPITGVAAGALGWYARRHGIMNQDGAMDKRQFVVAQGYDLGMGGNMLVDVASDVVHVGGYAVIYGETQVVV